MYYKAVLQSDGFLYKERDAGSIHMNNWKTRRGARLLPANTGRAGAFEKPDAPTLRSWISLHRYYEEIAFFLSCPVASILFWQH